MYRITGVIALLVVFVALFASSRSDAASTYSARSTAFLSVATASDGSLSDDLAYLGSSISYSGSAQASFDNGVLVDLDDASFSKTVTATPFTTILSAEAGLAGTLLQPTDGSFDFGDVSAITDEAEGFGSGTAVNDGTDFKLTADVNGSAFDTGDPAFANSKVRWDLSITFQNTGLADLTAIWTVQHFLEAAANADPKGTAFSTATFSTTGADDVVNGAADPPIPPNPQNGDGLVSNPPILSGTTFINFSLAAGQIKTLSVAVEARGNATIVPLPASGLVFFATLAGLVAFAGQRRLATGMIGQQRD